MPYVLYSLLGLSPGLKPAGGARIGETGWFGGCALARHSLRRVAGRGVTDDQGAFQVWGSAWSGGYRLAVALRAKVVVLPRPLRVG